MHLSLRAAGLFALALAAITCSDAPTRPSGSDGRGPSGAAARLGLAPSFTPAAVRAYEALTSLGVEVMSVRVSLTAADGTVAKDTVIAFPADQDALVVELSVRIQGSEQAFTAALQLRDANGAVLFAGTQQVVARSASLPPATPTTITMEYVGPGVRARTVRVTSSGATASSSAAATVTAEGLDSAGAVVPSTPFAFTVSDATLATVTPVGAASAEVRGRGRRGTVTVTARTPTGVAGSATLALLPTPTSIALVSGASQTTRVGRAAAAEFTVEVRAADELPIAGIKVAFGATTPGGSVGTASATTDASGRASSTIAAGKTAGVYAFSATAAGLAPLVTSLTATPALPAAIAVVSGGGQSAVAGTALPSSLVVKVSDEFGNGVSGTAVTWSVASGGGLLSGTSTTTDSTGLTSNGYLLGTVAGPNTITATSGSLSTTFSATALAGNAAKLMLLQGLPSSLPVGSAPASAIRVQVADAAGNAVKQAGTSITGSGVVTPGSTSAFTVSATTDADGVASFIVPTYVGPTGTATVTITSPGIATLVLGPVSIVTGPAAQLVIGTQPGATTTSGVALAPQPIVQLTDVGANAVRMAGVSVVATLGSGGGTLAGTTTVSTDANGAAAFNGLVIGGVPGARTLRFSASVGGATIATTSDTVSVNPPAVARLVKDTGVGADGQYVVPGASLGQRPRVRDARGDGIPGVAVTFTASSGTVSASAITDAAGYAMSDETGDGSLRRPFLIHTYHASLYGAPDASRHTPPCSVALGGMRNSQVLIIPALARYAFSAVSSALSLR